MRAYEILEGGWDSTVTQGTVITPDVVKAALKRVKLFIPEFNKFLKKKGVPPVKMGAPLGSSAYHDVDDVDKVYGDIDLQIVVPEQEGKTTNQLSSMYNKLLEDFIHFTGVDYIHKDSQPGHPIFLIGDDAYVQVDFLWADEPVADWARYRSTPARGVKGLVYGNMYSSLGELLTMSIQRAGVQMKTRGGEPVPFRMRKDTELETLSLDQENFGVDILVDLYKRMYPGLPASKIEIDPELEENPGIDKKELTIARMASVIKGLGKSFELNDMFGKSILEDIGSYEEFINSFLKIFKHKCFKQKEAKKFDKAETPEAIARREHTFKQIDDGVQQVVDQFSA